MYLLQCEPANYLIGEMAKVSVCRGYTRNSIHLSIHVEATCTAESVAILLENTSKGGTKHPLPLTVNTDDLVW